MMFKAILCHYSFFSKLEEGKVLAEVDVYDSYVTPLCDDDADDVIQCL